MEIEAKYRVARADLDVVAAKGRLGSYLLEAATDVEHQENRYFDTSNELLGQARHALRLRLVDGRALITFKGPAEVTGGLHRRVEYEFAHSDPDPHSWPAGPARDLALSIIGAAPLHQLLTIETERRIIHVLRDSQEVAELALDSGVFRAADRVELFNELEIELRPAGSLDDLHALAAAIGEQITLTPEPLSKLERARSLLPSGLSSGGLE